MEAIFILFVGFLMKKEALEAAMEQLGGQRSLARLLTERGIPVAQAHVWNWLNRNKEVPAHICPHLECMTHGEVTCRELRPDVFAVECTPQ